LENTVPSKSHQQLFGLKRTAFFPEPNIVLDKDSCWISFVTQGYIKQYHEAILESTDGGKLIRDMLDKIFENLVIFHSMSKSLIPSLSLFVGGTFLLPYQVKFAFGLTN